MRKMLKIMERCQVVNCKQKEDEILTGESKKVCKNNRCFASLVEINFCIYINFKKCDIYPL